MCTNSLMLRDLQSTPTRHLDCDLKGRNQMRVEGKHADTCFSTHVHTFNCIFFKRKSEFSLFSSKQNLSWLAFSCYVWQHQQKPIYKPNQSWQSAGHSCGCIESPQWMKSLKHVLSWYLNFYYIGTNTVIVQTWPHFFSKFPIWKFPRFSRGIIRLSSNYLATIQNNQTTI